MGEIHIGETGTTQLSYQLFGFPQGRGFPRALPTSRIIDGLNSLDSLAERWREGGVDAKGGEEKEEGKCGAGA